jgi:hypothetical protein
MKRLLLGLSAMALIPSVYASVQPAPSSTDGSTQKAASLSVPAGSATAPVAVTTAPTTVPVATPNTALSPAPVAVTAAPTSASGTTPTTVLSPAPLAAPAVDINALKDKLAAVIKANATNADALLVEAKKLNDAASKDAYVYCFKGTKPAYTITVHPNLPLGPTTDADAIAIYDKVATAATDAGGAFEYTWKGVNKKGTAFKTGADSYCVAAAVVK